MGTQHDTSHGYSSLMALWKQSAWFADGDSVSPDYTTKGLFPINVALQKGDMFKFVPGSTGQPATYKARRRESIKTPSGNFSAALSVDRAALLLEMMFGNISTGTCSFANATALPNYHLVCNMNGVDPHLAKNFTASRCTIGSDENGGDLIFSADGFATHLDGDATYPSIVIPDDYPSASFPAFQHYEAVLTLGGTGYRFKSVELVVDHQVNPAQRNSQRYVGFPKGKRVVSATVVLDWNAAAETLYDLWAAGTPFTFNLAYTIGATSITFASASNGCFLDGETPAIGADDLQSELRLPIIFTATNAGQNDELTCVIDSTP